MIVREALEFQRGQASKSSLDVGKNSTYLRRSYDELTAEEQTKAAEKYKETGGWDEYLANNWDFIKDQIHSDQFLLEPPHVNMVDKFGKSPYEVIGVEPMIDFNKEYLQYDLERNMIDLRNVLDINSSEAFLTYLGLPSHLLPHVYYHIGKDYIDIEWDTYDYEPTDEDEESLQITEKNFEKYVSDLIQSLKDQYNWYEENLEPVKNHLEYEDDIKYDGDLNPVKES